MTCADERAVGSAAGNTAAIRTLLFDLDGTLIDSQTLILASYRHTMRCHLGQTPADSAWLATMGTPLVSQLKHFARDDEEAKAMLATYREHNATVHDELIREFEGVHGTLQWLHGRGYRLGIVTSKLRDAVVRGLRACSLPEPWFEVLVTASDDVAHKPDAAPVLLALERMEEEASRALFVGDSVWDLRAGRAAGTMTAAALWGPFGRSVLAEEYPDYLLERIEDLKGIPGLLKP